MKRPSVYLPTIDIPAEQSESTRITCQASKFKFPSTFSHHYREEKYFAEVSPSDVGQEERTEEARGGILSLRQSAKQTAASHATSRIKQPYHQLKFPLYTQHSYFGRTFLPKTLVLDHLIIRQLHLDLYYAKFCFLFE